MPAKRRYSYMRKNAPAKPAINIQSAPPTPGHVGPWVNLNKAEPVVGQRVVVSSVDAAGARRYQIGDWAVTGFNPGIDFWMSVPNVSRGDPWVALAAREPALDTRVVVTFMNQSRRDYGVVRYGKMPVPPGVDFWMPVPDAA